MDETFRIKRLQTVPTQSGIEQTTSVLVSELLNAAVSTHKLHLKVSGTGSFSAHKALNEFYDELPELADAVAEGFQGAHEVLLDCSKEKPIKVLNSVEDCVNYLRELAAMVNQVQAVMPYTEIVNDLDNVKSLINSTKYKLLFLK